MIVNNKSVCFLNRKIRRYEPLSRYDTLSHTRKLYRVRIGEKTMSDLCEDILLFNRVIKTNEAIPYSLLKRRMEKVSNLLFFQIDVAPNKPFLLTEMAGWLTEMVLFTNERFVKYYPFIFINQKLKRKAK